MRALFLSALCMALASCAGRGAVKAPAVCPITGSPAPAVLSVPQARYVPIDAALTASCSWVRNGALEDMPEVARGRKRCLEFYEANLREIEAKQGAPASTEVRP